MFKVASESTYFIMDCIYEVDVVEYGPGGLYGRVLIPSASYTIPITDGLPAYDQL